MNRKVLFLKARTGMDDPSPPMSFSFLGRIAKDEGFEVLAENLNAQYNTKTNKDIIDLIKKESPSIVGIHIFTNCARDTYKLLGDIRPYCKTIIAGGPHATACPEELIEKGVDVVFIGEAEISFKTYLQAISKNKSIENVKGIVYKDGKKILRTKPSEIIYDLDKIPMPDKEIHRKSDYIKIKEEINNFGQILSTRGCPGRCTYCFSLFNKCYRFRSAENVFNEILYLNKKYRINFINFIDDAFTINKKRLLELCDLLINSQINFEWVCATRIDFLDKELISKMKKAGCVMISLGFESNIPETLIKIKKTGNPDWYIKHHDDILEWCYEQRIRVGVNTLVGFPWERPEDIRRFHEYAKKIRKYVTQGFDGGIIQPQPETEIYNLYAKKYGFEKWWIYKKPLFKDNYRPFFMLYYLTYWDHLHNNFFKFDKEVFKEIDNFYKMMGRWNLYVRTRRRFKNLFTVYTVYFSLFLLSKFSLFLFVISPKLERKLMEKIKKFSYRFKFRKGEQ